MTPFNKILLRWFLLQLLIIVQFMLFNIIIGTIMDIQDRKFIRKHEPTFPYSHTSVSLIVVLFWVHMYWIIVYYILTFSLGHQSSKNCILKFGSVFNLLLVLVLVMVHVWAFIVTRRLNKRRTVLVVFLSLCAAAQPWLAF